MPRPNEANNGMPRPGGHPRTLAPVPTQARLTTRGGTVRVPRRNGERKGANAHATPTPTSTNGLPSIREYIASHPEDPRGRVIVSARQHETINAAVVALRADSNLYHRNGELVHTVDEESDDTEEEGITRDAGTPRIKSVSQGLLRKKLCEHCRFVKFTDKGEVEISPPTWLISTVHTLGDWPQLRLLNGITETPVLRRDRSLLTDPGYDKSTGLLYSPGTVVPDVPANPSRRDAFAARDRLRALIAEFPFERPAHSAVWLAGLLTSLARRAFAGPAPLFLIDANVRGSGKSLLADLVGIIVTGRRMPRMVNPSDEDEARKRITSVALAGDPLVLIDNVTGRLGNAALDAALTGTRWSDRILGGNKMVDLPLRATWFATGNNIMLRADTARRCCHCRLESPEENPEERTGFQIPRLIEHAREHRLELLTAALTMLSWYGTSGRENCNLVPWGSYEGWSTLIRSCLTGLGAPDPATTRRQLAETADTEVEALRALFQAWPSVDWDRTGLTAGEIIERIKQNERACAPMRGVLLEVCKAAQPKDLTAERVGYALRRFRGRIMGGQRLDYRCGRSRQRVWLIASCDGDNACNAQHGGG